MLDQEIVLKKNFIVDQVADIVTKTLVKPEFECLRLVLEVTKACIKREC